MKVVLHLICLMVVVSGCQKADVAGDKKGAAKQAEAEHKNALAKPITKKIEQKSGQVFFKWPETGSKIFAGTEFVFGVNGALELAPAGTKMDNPNAGHHHVLVGHGPIDAGETIPMDKTHIHFGKAQTRAALDLPVGEHDLTLQFANGGHVSYGPPRSAVTKVDVAQRPEKVGVSISNLKPDAVNRVKSPIKLFFTLEGYALRPAGEDILDKRSGHHHILIDRAFMPTGEVIPMDEKHKHFGKAQTETSLVLPKGEHTLTLQLGDAAHRSYGEALSKTYRLLVE